MQSENQPLGAILGPQLPRPGGGWALVLGRREAGRSEVYMGGFIQDHVYVTPEGDKEAWRKSPEMTSH